MITYKIVLSPLDFTQQELIMAKVVSQAQPEGFEEHETALTIYLQNDEIDWSSIVAGTHASIERTALIDQNWNAVWESNFEPVQVDDFCHVRANFHPVPKNVTYDIVITPKMSFGTGHHATTFQVIKAMQNFNFKDKQVCDFGTGTGVLAILAEKLSAAKVLAIDNDNWSIENTNENIAANNCTKIEVQFSHKMEADLQFDYVLANINKNVLLAQMGVLSKALLQDGLLILSGILTVDQADLEKSILDNGLNISKVAEKDGWLCIICAK